MKKLFPDLFQLEKRFTKISIKRINLKMSYFHVQTSVLGSFLSNHVLVLLLETVVILERAVPDHASPGSIEPTSLA